MRRAAEVQVWTKLKKKNGAANPDMFPVGGGSEINLADPCTVLGGLNGAGKSRLLRQLAESLGSRSVLVDLHHLCEQALIVLRSRDDFDDMADESGPLGPDTDRIDDLKRIIGREYDSIEWFALDVEPAESEVAERFRWAGEQSLIPYFRAEYRGQTYTSKDMGLGEFSVHFLFWILDQYREMDDVVLLLDEPDAFLPPVGVASLLVRVLNLCLRRGWQVIVTTHAEEMITAAVEAEAFTLLRVNQQGETVALHSADDPTVVRNLVARPSVDHVIFCEDESAWYLTRALLQVSDRTLLRETCVVWGSGDGDLVTLCRHLPRPPEPDVYFAIAFDGDQRGKIKDADGAWPAVFLPTDGDPDSLFVSVGSKPDALAARLGQPIQVVERCLEGLEGIDSHDWVNGLAVEFGRPQVLTTLSSLWAEQNVVLAEEFLTNLRDGWT